MISRLVAWALVQEKYLYSSFNILFCGVIPVFLTHQIQIHILSFLTRLLFPKSLLQDQLFVHHHNNIKQQRPWNTDRDPVFAVFRSIRCVPCLYCVVIKHGHDVKTVHVKYHWRQQQQQKREGTSRLNKWNKRMQQRSESQLSAFKATFSGMYNDERLSY